MAGPAFVTTLAGVTGSSLALLRALGLAGPVTLGRGGVSFTADGVAEDDGSGGRSGAVTSYDAADRRQVIRQALVLSAVTTTGAALPFVPEAGDVVVWAGLDWSCVAATPIAPGAVAVAHRLELER